MSGIVLCAGVAHRDHQVRVLGEPLRGGKVAAVTCDGEVARAARSRPGARRRRTRPAAARRASGDRAQLLLISTRSTRAEHTTRAHGRRRFAQLDGSELAYGGPWRRLTRL